MKRFFRRILAGGVAVSLVFTSVDPALSSGRGADARRAIVLPRPVSVPESPLEFTLAALPREHGRIETVFDAGDRLPPVVLLQDVHQNPEAQEHIARLIESLARAGAADWVGVEGTFGAYDFSRFRAFQDAALLRALADEFVAAGLIGAPTVAAFRLAAGLPHVTGIDDEAEYRRNVAAYREAKRNQANTLARLKEESAALERRAAGLSPDVGRYLRERQRFENGNTALANYLRFLRKRGVPLDAESQRFLLASDLEANLEFAAVEQQRAEWLERLAVSSPATVAILSDRLRRFQRGQISFGPFYDEVRRACEREGLSLHAWPTLQRYFEYAAQADAIDPRRLFDEVALTDTWIESHWPASEAESALLREARRLRLSFKLALFSLTSADWEAYRTLAEPGAAAASFETFYSAADRRTDEMARRILAVPPAQGRVVVAGGFHARRLERLLRDRGVSFVSVTPRIQKRDEDGTAYLSIFDRDKSPLERLFEPDRLTINPTANCAGSFARESGPIESVLLGAAAGDFERKWHRGAPRASGARVTSRSLSEEEVVVRNVGQRGRGPTVRLRFARAPQNLPGAEGRTRRRAWKAVMIPVIVAAIGTASWLAFRQFVPGGGLIPPSVLVGIPGHFDWNPLLSAGSSSLALTFLGTFSVWPFGFHGRRSAAPPRAAWNDSPPPKGISLTEFFLWWGGTLLVFLILQPFVTSSFVRLTFLVGWDVMGVPLPRVAAFLSLVLLVQGLVRPLLRMVLRRERISNVLWSLTLVLVLLAPHWIPFLSVRQLSVPGSPAHIEVLAARAPSGAQLKHLQTQIEERRLLRHGFRELSIRLVDRRREEAHAFSTIADASGVVATEASVGLGLNRLLYEKMGPGFQERWEAEYAKTHPLFAPNRSDIGAAETFDLLLEQMLFDTEGFLSLRDRYNDDMRRLLLQAIDADASDLPVYFRGERVGRVPLSAGEAGAMALRRDVRRLLMTLPSARQRSPIWPAAVRARFELGVNIGEERDYLMARYNITLRAGQDTEARRQALRRVGQALDAMNAPALAITSEFEAALTGQGVLEKLVVDGVDIALGPERDLLPALRRHWSAIGMVGHRNGEMCSTEFIGSTRQDSNIRRHWEPRFEPIFELSKNATERLARLQSHPEQISPEEIRLLQEQVETLKRQLAALPPEARSHDVDEAIRRLREDETLSPADVMLPPSPDPEKPDDETTPADDAEASASAPVSKGWMAPLGLGAVGLRVGSSARIQAAVRHKPLLAAPAFLRRMAFVFPALGLFGALTVFSTWDTAGQVFISVVGWTVGFAMLRRTRRGASGEPSRSLAEDLLAHGAPAILLLGMLTGLSELVPSDHEILGNILNYLWVVAWAGATGALLGLRGRPLADQGSSGFRPFLALTLLPAVDWITKYGFAALWPLGVSLHDVVVTQPSWLEWSWTGGLHILWLVLMAAALRKHVSLGIALLVAGMVGNVTDVFWLQSVVNQLPTFIGPGKKVNFADVYMAMGLALWVARWASLRGRRARESLTESYAALPRRLAAAAALTAVLPVLIAYGLRALPDHRWEMNLGRGGMAITAPLASLDRNPANRDEMMSRLEEAIKSRETKIPQKQVRVQADRVYFFSDLELLERTMIDLENRLPDKVEEPQLFALRHLVLPRLQKMHRLVEEGRWREADKMAQNTLPFYRDAFIAAQRRWIMNKMPPAGRAPLGFHGGRLLPSQA